MNIKFKLPLKGWGGEVHDAEDGRVAVAYNDGTGNDMTMDQAAQHIADIVNGYADMQKMLAWVLVTLEPFAKVGRLEHHFGGDPGIWSQTCTDPDDPRNIFILVSDVQRAARLVDAIKKSGITPIKDPVAEGDAAMTNGTEAFLRYLARSA